MIESLSTPRQKTTYIKGPHERGIYQIAKIGPYLVPTELWEDVEKKGRPIPEADENDQ